MHAAPAHLESKLRFFDLSVGQIIASLVGIMLGGAWAMFLSPLHGALAAMSGAYIAALPVVPVFVASQTEFDLGDLVIGAVRWRGSEGRYAPGPGGNSHGYVTVPDPSTVDSIAGRSELHDIDLQALWDEP